MGANTSVATIHENLYHDIHRFATFYHNAIIAERRERSERSEANNRVLFEIPRYLYIYIYIYICLSASALCKTVHTLRKSYHVGRCVFGTLAAVRRTTLRSRRCVRYMDDGASSVEDSSDDDSDFSGTCTTTGHRKRRDDDSDLGRTRTATGQKKRSLISQTAAHREERLAIERLQHIPFFITSSYYTYTLPYTSFSLLYIFTLSPYPFFVITHLSNSYIAA